MFAKTKFLTILLLCRCCQQALLYSSEYYSEMQVMHR